MKTFADCVELIDNNPYCVLLKVKPICKMDLILMGCFLGDEDMIRYTKNSEDTITIFKEDGGYYSWNRGSSVVETMKTKRAIIMNYVKNL